MNPFMVSLGSAGSIASALAGAAPCCLPMLATVASAIGISSLLPATQFNVYLVQAFGILAAVGAAGSNRSHRKPGPLAVATVSAISLLVVYNFSLIAWLLYSALAGLILAAFWNHHELRRCKQCKATT